jgi:hypothetical protein
MMKILLASLAGTVVYFLVGWLVFEALLGKYMTANTLQITGFKKTEQESSMLMLLVSCAAYALLLAIILGQWAQVYNFKDGAMMGATVGILVAIMANSYWYSTTHLYNGLAPLLADVAAAGLTVGIMGGTIAWILGLLSK